MNVSQAIKSLIIANKEVSYTMTRDGILYNVLYKPSLQGASVEMRYKKSNRLLGVFPFNTAPTSMILRLAKELK